MSPQNLKKRGVSEKGGVEKERQKEREREKEREKEIDSGAG